MNCSIFSEVPKEPMVSMKSGLLYEKRLIERHISAYNEAKTNISCKHSWDAWNVPNSMRFQSQKQLWRSYMVHVNIISTNWSMENALLLGSLCLWMTLSRSKPVLGR
ncbi:uncharacterized protein LOC114314802 isoform X2 [Camellia sinensis]|uniref:uncharacterized protein LOC114314802 isoform X2 n=1 Tax=Camellia sinensis TaxID=4442 RepID=UPI00103616E2|nr:uncharacterized protein LOC114314802 isoform X2 [Camellia sinensis]